MSNHHHLLALAIPITLCIISAPVCQSSSCNLTDPTLHVCLHIFLERDYGLIEQIIYDSHSIKEGNELTENICRPVSEMISCYKKQLDRCSVYFYLRERTKMLQIISSLSDSYDIMCGEGKMGIKALKEGLPCLDSARRYGYCDINLTMQMNLFFKKLMRYQITSSTSCAPLAAFSSCLMANAKIQKPPCKAEAQHALRQALDSWMYNLCTRVGYSVHVEN